MLATTLALIKPDAVGQPWIGVELPPAPPPPKEVEDGEDGEQQPEEEEVTESADVAASSEPHVRSNDKSQEILKRIEAAGFKIVNKRRVCLDKGAAEAFYREHRGKPFFDALTSFMSSSPILALELKKDCGAIAAWRELMGPTNSAKAREESLAAHPHDENKWSLRALFGTDGTRNAVHGSDSAYSAEREINFFFPQPERLEKTVAIVAPDAAAAGKTPEVAAELEKAGFLILAHNSVLLTADTVRTALGAAEATPARVAALMSGPCDALLVERVGAVWTLRDAAGLALPSIARANNPTSFHAMLGSEDDVSFGVVAAPSAAAVIDVIIPALFPEPLKLEKTLALIKPGAADQHYRAIINAITAAGFSIVGEARRQLTQEDVDLFYAEHASKPFFPALAGYMTSGPVTALALAKPCAVKAWRQLMGPTNTDVAKREQPGSLRALYGTDGTRNAVHGSDSAVSAARELRFFFPDLLIEPVPGGPAASAYVRSARICDVYDPTRHAMVPKTLESVVTDGLVALAKAKPSSDPAEAVRWLGQWLMDNNPRTGIVTYKDGTTTTRKRGANAKAQAQSDVTVVKVQEEVAPLMSAPKALLPGATIVMVVAPPAVGKGTQCARIASAFGYVHLSTGDLLRAEVASGSPLGAELTAVMQSGGLVSDELVLRLLSDAMVKSSGTRFLVDGYPRSLPQALAFEKAVGQPAFVLSFTAPEAVLQERVMHRSLTSGRADDNLDSFKQRMATIRGQSQPVLDFYSSLGRVRSVDATGSVDDVFASVQPHFQPQLAWLMGPPAAGKTAAAEALTSGSAMGYRHLSVTSLLAGFTAAAEGGQDAADIAAAVARGDADVPPSLLVQLVKDAVNRTEPTGRYVLDGAPVNVEQAAALEYAFGPPVAVLNIDAADSVLLSRAKARTDSAALAKHRLETYRKGAQPVLDLYSKGALLRTIDAGGQRDTVTSALCAALQPRIVFVLGGPGSGKGTQCARIKHRYGFVHLSAGDLLRAEVQRGSQHGALINSYIAEGKIVPLAVTLGLIRSAMRGSGACAFLIDGFPRALEQALQFEADIGSAEFVLFFDCPEDTMRSRLLERGKTSGRVDDNEEAIVKRFHTFLQQSMPVVSHYATQGRVRLIDATPGPDAVFASVQPCFEPRLVVLAGRPGAGLTSQGGRVTSEFGYAHLSLQALLAADTSRKAAFAAAAAALVPGASPFTTRIDVPSTAIHPLAAGKLPTAQALALIKAAVAAYGACKVLLEGFPRTAEDATALEAALSSPACVINLEVMSDVAKARLLARDKTNGHLQPQELEEAVAARLAAFEQGTAPVLKAYARRGLLRSFSGETSQAAVYSSLRPVFQPQLAVLVAGDGAGGEEIAVIAGRELGYQTLHVTSLLKAHVSASGPHSKAISTALASKRTLPTSVVVDIIREAVHASGASRFLLSGFPRRVHDGFPAVHDQVFDLEAAIGPVKGCVHLTAEFDVRAQRSGASSDGQLRQLRERLQTCAREKEPVASFFAQLGKTIVIDTSSRAAAEVYEVARPFLE